MLIIASTTSTTSTRAFTFAFKIKTHFHIIHPKPRTILFLLRPMSTSASRSPPREPVNGSITLQEWQAWGTTSPLPTMVTDIVDQMKALEVDIDAHMTFGGSGGKLQGHFKVQEDKKHRATYQALGDSEKKLQFFSARQIACRLLGSRGYLCQKCWLPFEDCMCSRIMPCSLWHGMRFWLYMHPKDFLRQNNTGKLLWQVFGVEAATLCLFGITEQEEIMWNTFKHAGKNNVWCLYPNKNATSKSVQDAFGQESSADKKCTQLMTNGDKTLNFILIDGTWSNSNAMFSRLKEQAKSIWGAEDLPCISLATGASAMHKLRPQPSWDRTCTAAAAIGLLSELQLLPEFTSYGLDKQAEAVEDALVALLEALTTRRLRMGRSITRKELFVIAPKGIVFLDCFVCSSGHWSEIEFCLGATTKSSLNEASACACHVHWSLEWRLDFGGQGIDLFGSLASSNSSFLSDEIFESRDESTGRVLLQAKKACTENFENKNYTILTARCKGPQYPPVVCCNALKEFACPFADAINDLTTDCASTMFSYINLYGKYPPGLFSNLCREGKLGLNCTDVGPDPDEISYGVHTTVTHSTLLIITAGFIVFLLFHWF
ncbi:hypothetical protein CMV_021942 [Castanea mollissima]|uniref:tRNA-uridine aminocarboxypropyltransferase n=1 Tax=Castanea mollissima TaxID=60419 RepID=A0A8J4QVI3_9ROSI|nr:hypothetical protein CMV_021942 [Castanea mollissima]